MVADDGNLTSDVLTIRTCSTVCLTAIFFTVARLMVSGLVGSCEHLYCSLILGLFYMFSGPNGKTILTITDKLISPSISSS